MSKGLVVYGCVIGIVLALVPTAVMPEPWSLAFWAVVVFGTTLSIALKENQEKANGRH